MTSPARAHWPLAVSAALAATLPLVTDPGGWYVFVAGRWAVLVVATAALAILGAAGPLRERLGRVPATRWWLLLVGVAAVSAVASGAARVALLGTADRRAGAAMWLVHGALFVVGAVVIGGIGQLRVVLRGLSVGVIGVTVWVAAQRLGWSFPGGVGSASRPGGPLGNADFLGAYAALALLASIGACVDRAERDGWRLVHLVAAMGASFCLVVSGTRAGWVGVVAGLVAFGWLAARSSGLPARSVWAAVGVVALALIGLGMWAGVGDRLGTVTSGTAAGRVATWERTATVIGERPFLGWGPEGMASGFGRAVDASWEREYGRRLTPDRAHNGLLDVGASLGLVGLVAYCGVLGATGRAVGRTLRGVTSPAVVGVAAALVAYLVQQQFLFQLADVDALAWLLAGGVVGVGLGATEVPAPSVHVRRPTMVGLATARWSGVVVLAGVAVLAGSSVAADRSRGSASTRRRSILRRRFVVRPMRCDSILRRSTGWCSPTQRWPKVATSRWATPDCGSARYGRRRSTTDGSRWRAAGSPAPRGLVVDVEQSRTEVVALLRVDPARSDGWAELGELDLALGSDALAQRDYERALDLRPANQRWRLRLAVAADRAGDAPAARAAAQLLDPMTLDADGTALRLRLLAGTQRTSFDR